MSSYSTVRGSVVDISLAIPIIEEVPEVVSQLTLVNPQKEMNGWSSSSP